MKNNSTVNLTFDTLRGEFFMNAWRVLVVPGAVVTSLIFNTYRYHLYFMNC